ncbi:hypothetical protein PF007_g30306 [Phytophthora fragariae]|uniref:Uncharacterized protein n=1 Tax=Phytophthora fragariae TaxID=53985 RepID=A0A6A3PTP4_9STRA|nr:hypothetical protein PF007_g30306 [Phytophthora fragariae]
MHALPGSRAGHCRTATMTTSSSSSGIAGVDARPAWKPSWPLPHRHHDHQQQQSSSGIAGVDARPAWKPSWLLPHRHHDQQEQ